MGQNDRAAPEQVSALWEVEVEVVQQERVQSSRFCSLLQEESEEGQTPALADQRRNIPLGRDVQVLCFFVRQACYCSRRFEKKIRCSINYSTGQLTHSWGACQEMFLNVKTDSSERTNLSSSWVFKPSNADCFKAKHCMFWRRRAGKQGQQ
jgi:hypothetical protein